MLCCYLAGLEQIAGAPFCRSVSRGWLTAPSQDFLSTHWRKMHVQRTLLWGGSSKRTICSLWVSVSSHGLERGKMTEEGEINYPVKAPYKQIIRQFGGEAAWCFFLPLCCMGYVGDPPYMFHSNPASATQWGWPPPVWDGILVHDSTLHPSCGLPACASLQGCRLPGTKAEHFPSHVR